MRNALPLPVRTIALGVLRTRGNAGEVAGVRRASSLVLWLLAWGVALGLSAPPVGAQCGSWWQTPHPAPRFSGVVYAVAVLPNGDLVAGGERAGGPARWNGSSWSTLPGGGVDSAVNALVALPNGDLVAGG